MEHVDVLLRGGRQPRQGQRLREAGDLRHGEVQEGRGAQGAQRRGDEGAAEAFRRPLGCVLAGFSWVLVVFGGSWEVPGYFEKIKNEAPKVKGVGEGREVIDRDKGKGEEGRSG